MPFFFQLQHEHTLLLFIRETDISGAMVDRKSLPSSTRRPGRPKLSENVPTRQHSLRTCRTVETSYKPVRSQTRTRTSNASNNSSSSSPSPMITCANIGLQRKLYKQVLVAESDGKMISIKICFHSK